MIGKARKSKYRMAFADAEVDLVPMIDCIFLILLFFMLCGHITLDQRVQQVSPPPTKTAVKPEIPHDWQHEVINVYGSTQAGHPPHNGIRIDNQDFSTSGTDNYEGYCRLRRVLDQLYDRSEKFPDPTPGSKFMLPKVLLEIRADADTEYRVVQEIEQICSDSIDPFKNANGAAMMSKAMNPATAKPFVYLLFTTRLPGGR
jgi:hypothetical protein